MKDLDRSILTYSEAGRAALAEIERLTMERDAARAEVERLSRIIADRINDTRRHLEREIARVRRERDAARAMVKVR